jgi:NAD(P)H-hydrate repair Nnr-like enzyme with NAD(P)H-hydrate dehydratase domain
MAGHKNRRDHEVLSAGAKMTGAARMAAGATHRVGLALIAEDIIIAEDLIDEQPAVSRSLIPTSSSGICRPI